MSALLAQQRDRFPANVKLKSVLLVENITQRQLSDETGIDPATISMAIRGKRILGESDRLKICIALGRPESELF